MVALLTKNPTRKMVVWEYGYALSFWEDGAIWGAALLVLRRVRLCGEGSLEINGLLSGWKNDENIAFINGVDVG